MPAVYGHADQPGLDSAFVAAGAISLAGAVFTGLWLVRSEPVEEAAGSPAITTSS